MEKDGSLKLKTAEDGEMITNGAFSSEENRALAERKNIESVTTVDSIGEHTEI